MSVDIVKPVEVKTVEVKKDPPVEDTSALLAKLKEFEAKLQEQDKKLVDQGKEMEKQRIANAILSISESKRDFVKKSIEGESVEFAEKFVLKLKGMPEAAQGVMPNKNGEQEKFVPDDDWKLKRAKAQGYIN